jgi:hypothetical protein
MSAAVVSATARENDAAVYRYRDLQELRDASAMLSMHGMHDYQVLW